MLAQYVVKKHPIMFKGADIALINKCDLNIPGFDADALVKDCSMIKSDMKVLKTSAVTGEGIEELIATLGMEL